MKQNSKEKRTIGSKIEETPAEMEKTKPITPNTEEFMKVIIGALNIESLQYSDKHVGQEMIEERGTMYIDEEMTDAQLHKKYGKHDENNLRQQMKRLAKYKE